MACKDYSDLTLSSKTSYIDITKPDIAIALVGKEKVNGILKVKFEEELLAEGEIGSNLDAVYSSFNLDLKNLGSKKALFASKVNSQSEAQLQVVFINEEEKIKIEKLITIKTTIPPVSNIENVEGNLFDKIHPEKLNIYINELNKQGNGDSKGKRAAMISYALSTNSKLLETEKRFSPKRVVTKTDKVKIKVTVDTVYYKSLIARYPMSRNSWNGNSRNIEEILKEAISSGIDSIKSDFNGKMVNGKYLLEDEATISYSGEIGLYLVNIDETGNYFIQQFGTLIADNMAPRFSRSTSCGFNSDQNFDGFVCLDTKEFSGHSPYSVPFVGRVYGDVAKLYVNNVSASFKTGEDLYFRRSIHLNTGYNRIPIKIVDKKGHVTESYIPVTMEYIDRGGVNIDNEIYIDNY